MYVFINKKYLYSYLIFITAFIIVIFSYKKGSWTVKIQITEKLDMLQ